MVWELVPLIDINILKLFFCYIGKLLEFYFITSTGANVKLSSLNDIILNEHLENDLMNE